MGWPTRLFEWYVNLGVRSGDDRELAIRKRIFTPITSSGIFVATTLASVEYLIVDSPAFIAPIILGAFFVTSLLVLFSTGNLTVPIHMSFLGMLFLPPINQWSLGGLQPAGALMLWGIAAPFGALMFLGIRQAFPQFVLYSLVGIGVVLAERFYPAPWPAVPATISLWMYVFNFGGFVMFIFMSMQHFVGQRNEAMHALDREHALLRDEQMRSERLLLNILPEAIAQRLKRNEKYIADAYEDVTILFADIVGFTPLSARIAPDALVRLLNEVFLLFDTLAEKHGLEKIKTIGDAYMAAAGLPLARPDHAEACARMALDMQHVMAGFRHDGIESLQLRIGLHSGPVTAGVIGSSKFIYDLWGDAVNTASRMESHGRPGDIHVSERLEQVLRRSFVLEDRGESEIKGKGVMRTYVLRSERPTR